MREHLEALDVCWSLYVDSGQPLTPGAKRLREALLEVAEALECDLGELAEWALDATTEERWTAEELEAVRVEDERMAGDITWE